MFELYDFLLLRKRLDSVTEFGRFLLCSGMWQVKCHAQHVYLNGFLYTFA